MKKFFLFIILLIPFNVIALEFPEINSDKAIIYDLTDAKILYEKNSITKTSIASLTKILTTITALENITDLNTYVTITKEMLQGIYWNASVAGLKVGDKVTYQDLLYAIMLPSGADAAHSIAIALCGSQGAFVTKMNTLAQNIGMANSYFLNVTGLDKEGQYSTAQDVQKLLTYSLQNPEFKKIYTTKEYTLKNGLKVNSTIKMYEAKTNQELTRLLGTKTGTTKNAGLCLSSLINSQNHEILIITLNVPYDSSEPLNIYDTLNLITFLDENYVPALNITEETTIPLTNSKTEKTYPILNLNHQQIIFINGVAILFLILVIPHKAKNKK